jgi:hypothetical protein
MNGLVGSYFIVELEKIKEFEAFAEDDEDEKLNWPDIMRISEHGNNSKNIFCATQTRAYKAQTYNLSYFH